MDREAILNAFRGRVGFRTDGILTLGESLTDSLSGLFVNDIPGVDVPQVVSILCEKNRSGRNITEQDFLSQHYDNGVLSLVNDFLNTNGSLVTAGTDMTAELVANVSLFDQALRHKLAIIVLEEAIHTTFVNEAFEQNKRGWKQIVAVLKEDLFGYEYEYHNSTRVKPGWLSNIATTLQSESLNYNGPIFLDLGAPEETEATTDGLDTTPT